MSAALANLTFMSPVTSTAMRQNATVKILVKAVRAAPFTTLFAKDQASTESRADAKLWTWLSFHLFLLSTRTLPRSEDKNKMKVLLNKSNL